MKLTLRFLRTTPRLHPQLSCDHPSSSVSGQWIVPTAGLADRPFLWLQERPPPMRPPTCWCPLEARASPAPPVRPNQRFDRGEPACEITPLSCSHWARDILHPCRSSVQAPPTPPCLYFTPNVNGSFLDKKKERERKKKRKGDTGRNKEATARGACFTGSRGTVRAAVTAGRESQPKPRLSFSPLWLLWFTLASLHRLPGRKKWRMCLSSSQNNISGPFIRWFGQLKQVPLGDITW